MSAVSMREKRKTAGQRMTDLIGKAQEEDDAFWGHDTWVEDDSGNDSFRESDEDSELRRDDFDSDFDDSESDNEDEEAAAGEQEEKDIQKEERRLKKTNYVDVARGGREMLQRAKGVKGSHRAVGNGINAGIVLNMPPPPATTIAAAVPTAPVSSGTSQGSDLPGQALPTASVPPPPLVPSLDAPVRGETASATHSPKKARMAAGLGVRPTIATARERRSQTRKRDSRNLTPTYTDTNTSQANKKAKPQSAGTKKSRRRQYAQEELLLEAVKDTEPENQRWLLARKRVQESADQDKDAMAALRDKHRGKNVIQKYHSRRGCLITLTFPDMDTVPEILTRKPEPATKPEPLRCVITGKPARYRDPKTNRGYYDAAAFKELRRRFGAGEPLDMRPKAKPKPKKEEPPRPATVNTTGSATETKVTHPQPPKSPASSAFVVDLGGSQRSPGSTRTSGRKWKPSEKMIQGLGIKRESSASLETTPASIEVPPMLPSMTAKKQQLDAAKPKPSTATPNSCSIEPPQSTEQPVSIAATTPTASGSNGNSNVPVAMPKPSSSTNGKANKKDAPPANKARPVVKEPRVFPKTKNTTKDGLTQPRPETNPIAPKVYSGAKVAPPSEQIYIIPSDGESDCSGPRFVTQTELIMQAINNYSRAHSQQGVAAWIPNGHGKDTQGQATHTNSNNA